MVTKREKQLAILLLKERIERQTGKKVVLKEEQSKNTSTIKEPIAENITNADRGDIFELYQDTDANGAAFEIGIDELIQEAKERINDACTKQQVGGNLQTDGRDLRIAVKRLWQSKINDWKDNNI